jgi:hypothetical protein
VLRTIVIILSLTSVCTLAQSIEDKCTDPVYHQLDFLLGDWIAYDSQGKKQAQHTIQRLDRTCVIQDGWRSSSSTGNGYFYFEPADSTWNHIWMDKRGSTIVYSGQFDGNELLMISKPDEDKQLNHWYILSISYLPNHQLSVRKSLREEDGDVSLLEFHIYRKFNN